MPNFVVGGRDLSLSMTVALVAVFTATALATNYAMIDIWNVKLMDAIVFIAGFLFGLRVGLGSAIGTWTVYGFINPYGQDSFGLLAFLMAGECFYAVAGVALSRLTLTNEMLREVEASKAQSRGAVQNEHAELQQGGNISWLRSKLASSLNKTYRRALPYGRLSLFFAIVGFIATFGYDVLTNFGNYVFTTNSLYNALVIGVITGVPFALAHEISNIFFFSTLAPGTILTARRLSTSIRGRA